MDQPRTLKGLIVAAVAVGAVLITALVMLASGDPDRAVVETDVAVSAKPAAPASESAANPAGKIKWHDQPAPAASTVFLRMRRPPGLTG